MGRSLGRGRKLGASSVENHAGIKIVMVSQILRVARTKDGK